MSLHTWRHQGPCKPSSCSTFMLNPHWGRAATGQKKKSGIYACSVTSILSDCLQPCRLWPAKILCQRWGSPGKNTGGYWPILVAIPFLSTIFPTTLDANPPEYLVLPEALGPKQHHLHTWPSLGQIQVLWGSLSSKHL